MIFWKRPTCTNGFNPVQLEIVSGPSNILEGKIILRCTVSGDGNPQPLPFVVSSSNTTKKIPISSLWKPRDSLHMKSSSRIGFSKRQQRSREANLGCVFLSLLKGQFPELQQNNIPYRSCNWAEKNMNVTVARSPLPSMDKFDHFQNITTYTKCPFQTDHVDNKVRKWIRVNR